MIHQVTGSPIRLHEDSALQPVIDGLKFFQQLRHHRPTVLFVFNLKVQRVALFSDPVFGRLVLPPNLRPPFYSRFIFIERFEFLGVAKNLIDHSKHVRARAPRFVERINFKLIPGPLVVFFLHTVEQPGIAAAPLVNGLLLIADAKERALTAWILHHLVDEIFHRPPLYGAGVLKFIEQPVVKLAVQAVLKIEPIRGLASEQHTAITRREQQRQVAKHQTPGTAHLHVVTLLVRRQQAMNPSCALQFFFKFPGDAVAQNAPQFSAEILRHRIGFFSVFKFPFAPLQVSQSLHRLHDQLRCFLEKPLARRPLLQVIGEGIPVAMHLVGEGRMLIDVPAPVAHQVRQLCLLPHPRVAAGPDAGGVAPAVGTGHSQQQLVAILQMLHERADEIPVVFARRSKLVRLDQFILICFFYLPVRQQLLEHS